MNEILGELLHLGLFLLVERWGEGRRRHVGSGLFFFSNDEVGALNQVVKKERSQREFE